MDGSPLRGGLTETSPIFFQKMNFDSGKIRTALFDLDGTLIDNFTAIHRCYSDVAESLGLVPKSLEAIRAAVGGSISLTMSRLIGDELAPEGIRRFREHFPEVMFEGVFVLPGVKWILRNLRERGVRAAVFTNKDHDATLALLAHLGLADLLDAAFGTGTEKMPWRKPQREYSEAVLAAMDAVPSETLMVGDSPFDIQAAETVGMPVACVATGTHMPETLLPALPDPELIFGNMFQLGHSLWGFGPESDAKQSEN